MKPAACIIGPLDFAPFTLPFLQRRIRPVLQSLIDQGISEFMFSLIPGFDYLVGKALLALIEKHPHIRITVVHPPEDSRPFALRSVQEEHHFDRMMTMARRIVSVSPRFYPDCPYAFERYMVEECCACITYCWQARGKGRVAYSVSLAHERGLTVYNLAHRHPGL